MVDSGGQTTYVYSSRNELLSQTLPGGCVLTMAYDPVGNRIDRNNDGTAIGWTYEAANRIVTMLQGSVLTTYSYDATENQTGEQAGSALTTNVYDNENRLVQVRAAAGLSTYGYDGDGLRRHAQEPGAANPTTFIWDGSDYLGEYAS